MGCQGFGRANGIFRRILEPIALNPVEIDGKRIYRFRWVRGPATTCRQLPIGCLCLRDPGLEPVFRLSPP